MILSLESEAGTGTVMTDWNLGAILTSGDGGDEMKEIWSRGERMV